MPLVPPAPAPKTGVEPQQKLRIGSKIAAELIAKLLTDLASMQDESTATAAVERELISNDVSRGKRKAVIDQHAAIFILQGALDRLANWREAR